MRRSEQRQQAVFALYRAGVLARAETELPANSRGFSRELVAGVEDHREEIDAHIARLSRGWDIKRIAALDLNIMRVAIFEMIYREDIPVEVSIDEAVNLAREYCGADAPGFVNGVLGSVARELEEAAAGEATTP